MVLVIKWFSISLVLVLLLICDTNTYCQRELKGKVILVADGDTFTMLVYGGKKVKVRLYGIDCPEMDQAFGDAAKKFLVVQFRLHKDSARVVVKNTDRYGRKVGIAFTGKTNINEVLLEKGLAWHYTKFDQNPSWARLEREAKVLDWFIWSEDNPIPPWEWREKKSKKKK